MKKKSAFRTRHKTHFYIIFAAFAVTLGVIGTVVISKVIAQTNEIIYACIANNSGLLRIVYGHEDCRPNENPLNWNKQGPAGPPGESPNTGLPFFSSSEAIRR